MRRTLTGVVACVFASFLFIGGVNEVQDFMQNVENMITPPALQTHLLSYE